MLELSIQIAAYPARVWELVSDVCRMAEWSPQVISTRPRSGYHRCELGTQFTNRNRHGRLEWTTHAEVVRFTPERELAYRIEENWVAWSLSLEPTDEGASTLLTQRRETPEGISDFSLDLTDRFMGGQEVFTQTLRAGMRQTLQRLKAAAEGRHA